MKRLIRALVISLALHFLYAAVIVGWGYVQTLLYVPDFSEGKGKVLQDELAFGAVWSLGPTIASIMAVTAVIWLILQLAGIKKAAL